MFVMRNKPQMNMVQEGYHASESMDHPAEQPIKKLWAGFPGGSLVKNPPANAGDTGSIPGPGRSHMPQSN